VVGIDMPLGLVDAGRRQADLDARDTHAATASRGSARPKCSRAGGELPMSDLVTGQRDHGGLWTDVAHLVGVPHRPPSRCCIPSGFASPA
jgi:hypothetical protein